MKYLLAAIVLVQVGSRLYVDPTKVSGLTDLSGGGYTSRAFTDISLPCNVEVLINNQSQCSDWSLEKIQNALKVGTSK